MRRGPREAPALALFAVTALAIAGEGVAHAHPLGPSSINRYEGFEYAGDARFRVAYRVDFAEGPAYAEVDALDADHDGAVTPAEQARYLASRLPVLVGTCVVEVNGVRVAPNVVASHVETVAGDDGKETLQVSAELAVVGALAGPEVTLRVHDDGFGSVPGWREIVADDGARADGGVPTAPTATTGSGMRTIDASFVFRARQGEARELLRGWRRWLAGALALLALFGVVLGARLRRTRGSVNVRRA